MPQSVESKPNDQTAELKPTADVEGGEEESDGDAKKRFSKLPRSEQLKREWQVKMTKKNQEQRQELLSKKRKGVVSESRPLIDVNRSSKRNS